MAVLVREPPRAVFVCGHDVDAVGVEIHKSEYPRFGHAGCLGEEMEECSGGYVRVTFGLFADVNRSDLFGCCKVPDGME